MKLEYKILWIDNDDSIFLNHQSDIEEHLINLGFTPIIKKGKNFSAFSDFATELDDFNLFILDYKLDKVDGKVINGNEIIKEIRNTNSIYTDVIFYSGVPDDVRQKIFDDKLSGIYVTSRDFEKFEDDVLGVINVTIKKFQDVNNLRGLIMAEVAELDRIKETILKTYSEKNKCGTIENYIIEKLNKSYADNLKKVAKYTSSSLNDIFENLYVDSDKKARGIKKVQSDFDEKSYRENILYTRNKFAHIEEISGTDENGEPCKFIGDIPFTEEKCIEIRKEIKNYKEILEDIKNSI